MPAALVTGASRGIGRAIALRLAEDHDIIAVARSEDDLATVAGEVRAKGSQCRTIALDLADGTATERALAGVQCDVLVNNAGIGYLKPFLQLTPEEWHRMVDVNLNALYHVTRAVLPGMVERRHGHVVVIGSIAGRSAFTGGSGYGATKHAVMGFTESLMLEVREHGVKVSVVNPGSVRTDFGSGDFHGKTWALAAEDVAAAVAYVVSQPEQVNVHRLEVRAAFPKK